MLVSIERDGRVIIPHGDTVLHAGDRLIAFTRTQDADALYRCLHHNPLPNQISFVLTKLVSSRQVWALPRFSCKRTLTLFHLLLQRRTREMHVALLANLQKNAPTWPGHVAGLLG